MAHAGTNQYAESVVATGIHTGEIEVRTGIVYIRMSPHEAAELARQLAMAIESAPQRAEA